MTRFRSWVILGSVFLSLSFSFLFGPANRAAAGQRSSAAKRAKAVNELYNRNCARCHGPDGRGQTQLGQVFNTPDFTDAAWWRGRDTSSKTLRRSVARGKAGMPAFANKLTQREIGLLVDRMRKFRK